MSPHELPALPLDQKRRVGLHYETYSQSLGPSHTLGTQVQKLIILTQSVFAVCLPFFRSDTIHSSLRLSPARFPKSNGDEESKSRQDYVQIAKVTQKSKWDSFAMPDRILTSEISCEGPLVMDESGDEAGSQSGSAHHCSLLPYERNHPRL